MDQFGADFGLVFDRARVQEACQKLSTDLSAYRVHFSVKSFPERAFLSVLASLVQGWDLSSDRELDLVLPLLSSTHSLWLTNSDSRLIAPCLATGIPVFFTLDHTSEFGVPYPENLSLGLRLDPYALLSRGHSRYGFTLAQLDGMDAELKRRIKFLHVHCPGVITAAELSGIRQGIEKILPEFPNVSLLNLGGGLTSKNIDAYEMLPQLYATTTLSMKPEMKFF